MERKIDEPVTTRGQPEEGKGAEGVKENPKAAGKGTGDATWNEHHASCGFRFRRWTTDRGRCFRDSREEIVGCHVSIDPVPNVLRTDGVRPEACQDFGDSLDVTGPVELSDQLVQSSRDLQGSSVREKDQIRLLSCTRGERYDGNPGTQPRQIGSLTHSSMDRNRERVGSAWRTRPDRGRWRRIASRRHRSTARTPGTPARAVSPVLR